MTTILNLILEAVRICLFMRCFHTCIGEYRLSKKIATAAFFALWTLESLLICSFPVSREAETMTGDFFFFVSELPAFLLLSLFYRGKVMRHLLMSVLLPCIYWGGKWMLARTFFPAVPIDSRRYLIATAAAVALLAGLTAVFGRAEKSRQARERARLEEELRIYENQFRIIRQSRSNIRALRHDLKHHIKMLGDLIKNGELNAALDYLAAMGEFMDNDEEYVSSGNENIDSILNYMLGRAIRSGAAVEWSVQIPEHLDIPAFDINVILSNLFENALNALAHTAHPSLHFEMKYDRGILCISTQNNDLNSDPNFSKQIFTPEASVTNHETDRNHGFGLKNIRRIAEKYHGSLTITREQGHFFVSVLLFLSETL